MIASLVDGSGNSRKVIALPRNPALRKTASAIIKRALFPTQEAHDAAMAQGTINRTAYQAQQRSNRT